MVFLEEKDPTDLMSLAGILDGVAATTVRPAVKIASERRAMLRKRIVMMRGRVAGG